MICATHQPYLPAIADGELALVPASTLAHVRDCPTCKREVETHSLLSARLRQAAQLGESPTRADERAEPAVRVGVGPGKDDDRDDREQERGAS